MDINNLLESWNLPDRTQERTQITLRISVQDYARLHALKAVYPTRSVNDFICDILRVGLDGIVNALPSYEVTEEDVARGYGHPDEVGTVSGPKITYQANLSSILNQKSEEEAA